MSIKKFPLNINNPNELYSSKEFNDKFNYLGDDLGVTLKNNKTQFKLWAPISSKVYLNIFKDGHSDSFLYSKEMNQEEHGIFSIIVNEDLNGLYYTFSTKILNDNIEIVDPYARAVGVNGKRGMIINLNETNPTEWTNDTFVTLKNKTDAIIYESHLRDFSTHESSGIKNKGKFLCLTEMNSKNSQGDLTGISHLKDLGITHIHLLPIYDFASIDETSTTPQYNWGYDPQNYNSLEGSYSTNPFDGSVRIKEFKESIKFLHSQNIGVIMDVVYNHTYDVKISNLNKLVPNYYYRINDEGDFSNGSGCGNEINSERFMARKLIIESLIYLTKEYHLDGFRFDLMGLIDIDTMNQIENELTKINPNILLYGEGWEPQKSTLKLNNSSSKLNACKLSSNIACFSDDIRDAMRGSFFDKSRGGFVSNVSNYSESIRFGVVASTHHPFIDYSKVIYSKKPWAKEPTQCINYDSCHDDETIFDRIYLSNKDLSLDRLISINKMCAFIVLTSQGIPFMHSGEEFLRIKRNKNGDILHNTYNSPDEINQLNWDMKSKFKSVFEYYKGLITIRKNHEAFRMPKQELISKNITFIDKHNDNFVSYIITHSNDKWRNIAVLLNPSDKDFLITLPKDNWIIVCNNDYAGEKPLGEIKGNSIHLKKYSQLILVDKDSF